MDRKKTSLPPQAGIDAQAGVRKPRTTRPVETDLALSSAMASTQDSSPVGEASSDADIEILGRIFDREKIIYKNYVETHTKIFEEGVVLVAWDIWIACRESDLPVPDVILEYIDTVAEAFRHIAERPPSRINRYLNQIIGVPSRKGRGSAFTRYQKAMRDLDISADIAVRKSGLGGAPKMTLEKAIHDVAENPQISPVTGPDTTRRAYARNRLPGGSKAGR